MNSTKPSIGLGVLVLLLGIGLGVMVLLFGITAMPLRADDDPFVMHKHPPIVGRWNLTVEGPSGVYPSWLEITQSGYRTLVGSYVGQLGSARPISIIDFSKGEFTFAIPPQWEKRTDMIHFAGRVDGDNLHGETTDEKGRRVTWVARKAPPLVRTQAPRWGEPIELFNGRDLTDWRPRNAALKHGWVVQDGTLVNATPGNDLMTESKFDDFKLRAEFRYPKGSNSGIYLRGRYEFQIEDDFGDEPDSHKIGGVYGFLTPNTNAAKKPDEWQTVEVTLVGRLLTVELNGEPIIVRQTIPGITGGALDSDEGQPGPILLQGDHGRVEFRKLTLTPGL